MASDAFGLQSNHDCECTDFTCLITLQQGFQFLSLLGKILVGFLAQGMKIPSSSLTAGKLIEILVFNVAALEPECIPTGEFSHSILSIYRYFLNPEETESCKIHKDMGVLTLVPRAEVPGEQQRLFFINFFEGLQVLDYENVCWIDIEKMAHQNDIVVFSSECLERMTASYYTGCVHRVVREDYTKMRSSIVFKLRAKTDFMIDCAGLNSPELKSIMPEFRVSFLTWKNSF